MDSPIPIPQTRPADLLRRLKAGEPLVLLDVREPEERDYCRIASPPAFADIHLPLGELPGRLGELDPLLASAPSARLIVYCHHGVRSQVAASWLARHGFENVENLSGGIDAWSLEVDPSVPRY